MCSKVSSTGLGSYSGIQNPLPDITYSTIGSPLTGHFRTPKLVIFDKSVSNNGDKWLPFRLQDSLS